MGGSIGREAVLGGAVLGGTTVVPLLLTRLQDEGPQSSQEALWNSCSKPNSVNENSMEDLPSFRFITDYVS